MEAMLIVRALFSFLLSFLVTYYLVPLCSKIAFRWKILDCPDGTIKVHKKPTPYLGGLAVYIGFISTLALVLPFDNKISFLLVGITLLVFVGLIDDLVVVSPGQKMLGQIIATLCFLKAGLHLKENFFLNHYWSIPLSCLWFLTVINAFNLVDIMDGLSSTVALGCTLSFIAVALLMGQTGPLVLLLAFFGAVFAFLLYNKPPARIYLGDTGSLLLGGFLGTVPFLFEWSSYNWCGFVAPIVILAIPLIEVGSLIIIRTYLGIPFYNGSPHHFAIFLKRNGWRVPEILSYVFGMSLLLTFISISLVCDLLPLQYVALVALLFSVIWLSTLLYTKKSVYIKA